MGGVFHVEYVNGRETGKSLEKVGSQILSWFRYCFIVLTNIIMRFDVVRRKEYPPRCISSCAMSRTMPLRCHSHRGAAVRRRTPRRTYTNFPMHACKSRSRRRSDRDGFAKKWNENVFYDADAAALRGAPRRLKIVLPVLFI